MKQNFNTQELLYIYEQMLFLRKFEERAGQLYGMGFIGGFCHLYIGQEPIAVALAMTKQEQDYIITSYRAHGMMLALGSDPKAVMAELFGKETGCSKGKGGSMHMFDKDKRFYGGHGIVGAQVPLGTGLAFASKYKKENAISITIFGDGAVNQGQVYEAFNMAKLWNLPVLYIIENNGYSMGTAVNRGCASTNLYNRGASFDIHGERVNGMDFFELHEKLLNAIARVRETSQPFILEIQTYRYKGHSVSDPGTYREKEEVEKYKALDAIKIIKNLLLESDAANENAIKEIDQKVKDSVKECEEFAKNSNEPSVEELKKDVYANNLRAFFDEN